jgi:hypothetical protein
LNTYFNFAESKEKRSRGNAQRKDPLRVEHTGAAQARKSTRWMPRRVRPMKDVETDETFKGSCIQAMSLENPNGATHPE